LKEIKFEDLRQHRAKMLGSGDYQPATVNRYFSALRRMLTLAVQDGVLDRHPMKGLKFLPEPQKDRFFSDDELEHLKGFLAPEEWRAAAIALGTGMRLSEQFGLQWKHINEEARTISIPLPKGNKTRRIPISDEVMELLREQFSASPWLFPDPMDPTRPQAPYPISDRFSDRLIQAGVQGASWHTFRHTFASRLLQKGVDIVTVSRLLGHSTIQTTMRYLHLVKDQLHQAVNRVSIAKFSESPVRTTTGLQPRRICRLVRFSCRCVST
jgi:integrase